HRRLLTPGAPGFFRDWDVLVAIKCGNALCTTRPLWRTLRVGTMENRSTRTLSANRNGLNLGSSTKFVVALSVNARDPMTHPIRHAHPRQQHQRCDGYRCLSGPQPIPIGLARHWSIKSTWPTERAISAAFSGIDLRLERSRTLAASSYLQASKRTDSFG